MLRAVAKRLCGVAGNGHAARPRLPQGSRPDSAAVQQAIRLLDLRLGLVACMQPAVGNRQRPCQSLWAPTADMEQGRSSCTPVITSQWTGRPSALPHLPRQRTARRGLAPFQVPCLLPVGRANPGCALRFPINGVVPGPCPARFPDPGCPISPELRRQPPRAELDAGPARPRTARRRELLRALRQ